MKLIFKKAVFIKIPLCIILIILIFPNYLFSNNIDKTINEIKSAYGVQVHYKYNKRQFFPTKWIKKPISGVGKQILIKEVERLLPIIKSFLIRCPEEVIKKNLSHIFLLQELKFYGKNFGGTNSRRGLYITSKGIGKGYTDAFLINALFHEFSSILLRNYKFPKNRWKLINSTGFKYKGSGVEMLGGKNLFGQTDGLLKRGFLVKYSQSSLENDFNMMSSWLFTRKKKLEKICTKYEKIRKKKEIAEDFYISINRGFKFE